MDNELDEPYDTPESSKGEVKKKEYGFLHVFLFGKCVFTAVFFAVIIFRSLGLVMKFGGCAVNWNYGFYLGFYNFFIYILFFGMGYLFLGLCMAEIVSVMAFDGGYYGYARVLMGPLGGYLVGCSGLIESLFYFTVFPVKITEFIEIIFALNYYKYRLLILLIVYVCLFLSFLLIQYKSIFWNFIIFSSSFVMLLFIIFFLGSIPAMDFNKYALTNEELSLDWDFQASSAPMSVLFFMGFDLISLTSHEIKEVSDKILFSLSMFLFLTLFAFFSFLFLDFFRLSF
jgi:amino acid transporter